MGTSNSVLAQVVANEITEVYDEVEALLGRISVSREPDICVHLENAKNSLWQARMLADERTGRT